MSRKRRKKAELPSQLPIPASPPATPPWQWWLVAAAIPLALSAAKLNLDLWYDEAYTIQNFVSRSWMEIATDYSAPNNHVFYSLVLRPFYLISGSEFMLRLPSLLFTAGTLALVFRLALRTTGLAAAVIATAFLGLTQMFLVHTMQVRGYGLSMLLAAGLANLTLPAVSGTGGERRLLRLAAIALTGAALLYVMPSNVLMFAPLGSAAVLMVVLREERSWRAVAEEIAAWGAACAIAGLLYLPILGQVRQAGGSGSVTFSAALAMMRQVLSDALHDWLPILPLVIVGLAVWIVRAARRRSKRDAAIAAGALIVLFGPFVLTVFLPGVPFIRNYCPWLPLAAVVIGRLLAECGSLTGTLKPAWAEPPKMALAGLALLSLVALPQIAIYPARLTEYRNRQWAQDGYYNYYAANYRPAELIDALQATLPEGENYRMCFAKSDWYPLAYYAARAGLPLDRIDPANPAAPLRVYLILPAMPDYPAVAARCGLTEETLRAFPLVEDFGYFRLHRSPELLPPPVK